MQMNRKHPEKTISYEGTVIIMLDKPTEEVGI